MEDLSRANTHFTLDLFRKLSETNEVGNIFFSPLSISLALAMVYGGAKTNTASQIAKVFHFDKVVDLHSGFQTLQLDINKAGAPYVLKTANRLYGEKTFNFLEEFIQTCIKLYGANLLEVNFQNAADEARQEINKWVEDQTEGKIQDLLAPGTVDYLTKLVLVNAIYFKGSWAEKFDEKVTEEMPFKLNKNESRPVKMMYLMKKFRFNYIPEAKCKVLELPYVGKELNMIIMLPDDIEDGTPGLKQLETKLTLENLQKWTKLNSGPVEVHVRLPKFKLEDNYELGPILSTLGKIQDLLAPGIFDDRTKLVLVNAIYFKGSWAEKFDENKTKEMPFKINKNESRPVKMMYLMEEFHFNYIPKAKCKVLELPYVGKELNMIIMLPDDIKDGTPGLKQLETKLTLENLQKWTKLNSGPVEVQVCLPKFKLEANYKLGPILSTLGMQDLFDDEKADISGMSGCRDLYVSRVVHKSFLEVNEEGTEAAAATAVMDLKLKLSVDLPKWESFTADRPFLFFIRHSKTNSILFFGRFSSPE